jgi:hypothetical protein
MIDSEKSIVFQLPLTTATGKVRVKRRVNNFGEPIATTSNILGKNDYFEWQISYFLWLDSIWNTLRSAPDKWPQKSRELFGNFKSEQLLSDLISLSEYKTKALFMENLRKILTKHNQILVKKPLKDNREFVANELSDLFRAAWEKNLISREDIQSLLEFNTGPDKIDIEADYEVKSEKLQGTISDGFERYTIHTPLFIKKIGDLSFVEIAVKHKQRAVGFQSMIYFGYYLRGAITNDGKPVIGRSANKQEVVSILLNKEHLVAIAKAFIIASESHSWDMKKILQSLFME